MLHVVGFSSPHQIAVGTRAASFMVANGIWTVAKVGSVAHSYVTRTRFSEPLIVRYIAQAVRQVRQPSLIPLVTLSSSLYFVE